MTRPSTGSAVPRPVLAAFGAALLAQVLTHAWLPAPSARAEALGAPPGGAALALMRSTEPLVFAHLLALRLQAYDNQPGISIPFRDLDYQRVTAWLATVLALDPRGSYPLMMASQLYAQVPDPARTRLMLEFVHQRFLEAPEGRWRWLAHAAIIAKHRLRDLPLALRYARSLAARGRDAPSWARQMHIFLLEDLGEYEAARILLGGLLAGNGVTDPHERLLLLESLERLKGVEKSSAPSTK